MLNQEISSIKTLNSKEFNRYTLSNGMKVLAIPSKSSPVVALQGWIRFGAADESPDIAGLAHFFEHLLFKGTEKRSMGQIAVDVEKLGGDLNAFTSYDQTVMHLTLGAEHLESGLEILADALQNSKIEDEELAKERIVVLEEIKRRNDSPGARASDNFRKLIFAGHPYERPVIGYPEVVEKLNRQSVEKRYRMHYNSENVFLVIAGDFKENELLEYCEKYFSKFPKGSKTPKRTRWIQSSDKKSFFEVDSGPDNIWHVGWPAPSLDHAEAPALDTLAFILGQGESSRLYKTLVLETKLARDVGAGCWTPQDQGSFDIYLKGPKGMAKNASQIWGLIKEELLRPITSKELEKARHNILSSAVYSKETVDGLAHRFGFLECSASAELDHEYYKRIKHLDVEDIDQVRKKWLNPDKCLAGGILAKGESPLDWQKVMQSADKSKPSKQKATSKDAYGVERFEVNGLTVLLRKIDHLPLFSAHWLSLGGARLENPTLAGIGQLWSRTVTNGGTALDGKIWSQSELLRSIEERSASLSAYFGRNSSGFSIEGLSDDFEFMLKLLCACKLNPSFDEKLMQDDRERLLHDLKSAEHHPGAIVNRLFSAEMFGFKHPYGRPLMGTASTIKKVKAPLLRAFHSKLEREPQVLSIVGNIDSMQVKELLAALLNKKRFTKTSKLLKSHTHDFKKFKAICRSSVKDKEQTHILMGVPGPNMNSQDRLALSGLSAILSGQSGRLFIELRDKQSLCYTVSASLMSGFEGGSFSFYIGTSPEKEKQALSGFDAEINRLLKDGVEVEEWERARNYFVGAHQLDQQRFNPQAMGMGLDELYGFGYADYYSFVDRFKTLGVRDLEAVAHKYLGPKNFEKRVIAIVEPS